METKKKHRNRPAIVSIGCSGVKSFLRTLRRRFIPPEHALHLSRKPKSTLRSTLGDLLSNSSPRTPSICIAHLRNGRLAQQAYLKRAQQSESDLGEWLEAELQLRDFLIPSPATPFSLALSSPATSTADNGFSVELGNRWDDQEAEMQIKKALKCPAFEAIKLGNGNYICMMQMRTPSRKLIMQFSEPALVSSEAGSTTLEILHNMASLGPKRLLSCLHQLMPLVEMSSDASKEMKGRAVTQGTTSGLMEDVLVSAMNKMEDLIVEGLRIQTGTLRERKLSKIKPRGTSADQINAVALLQLRGPYNAAYSEYEAIGDVMIVLIEAFVEKETTFWINSITVAGVMAMDDKNENLEEEPEELHMLLGRRFRKRTHRFLLWSIGKTLQHQCRTQLFRHQDIVFGDD